MRNIVGRAAAGKLLPRRKKMQQMIKDNPAKTAGLVTRGIEQGIKHGSQNKDVHRAAKKRLKKADVKDLAVNTGGFTASKAGAAIGAKLGPVGSKAGELAGDYAGARGVRHGINRAYADTAALKQRKKGESWGDTRKRARNKRKTMGKIDKRNNANTDDRVGWAIGNSAAELGDAAGIKIPLKGAAVAMTTGGAVSDNIKAYSKGKKTAKVATKDAAKEIGNTVAAPAKKAFNVLKNPKKALKKAIRKGHKREAKAKRYINKKAQQFTTDPGNFEFKEKRRRVVRRRLVPGMNFSECQRIRKRRKRIRRS